MAIIKCPECGKEYSNNADSCPNCGNPTNGKIVKNNTNSSNNNFVSSIISLIIVIVGGIYLYPKIASFFNKTSSNSDYDTDRIYKIGETLDCPSFDITIDSVNIKKKGTKIDSYQVIDDPEWVGVILTVKNKSDKTKTFYSSNVDLISSNGEVISNSWLTYKIWGTELLESPELISGGSKTGYIQFSNNDTDNSNLMLKVDCDTGLFEKNIIYKVNISQ